MRPRQHFELSVPLAVGALLGGWAGIFTGIVAGPAGALLGLGAGALVGAVAGMTMYRDDGRRAARSRELDRDIGLDGGDMGANPVSIPPPEPSDVADYGARERWLAEWLTPPPPLVG